MEEHISEYNLPELGYAEGFNYLYELLSHLTSSRQWFAHKISTMLRLSRETQQSHFTRTDIGIMLPQYTAKEMDIILNSLMEGSWLVRQEGTLQYSLSKSGLLFLRFLPFLYRGDEMDEMDFQLAVTEILNVAGIMGLDLPSLELLRDQILYSVQRSITELSAALISKNEERIRKLIYKISGFIGNIDDLIERIREINHYKLSKGIELTESDRYGIEMLCSFNTHVMSLYNELSPYYLKHQLLATALFTKNDIDRLLTKTSFYQLAAWISKGIYAPSCSSWLDEYDLAFALDLFLQKRIRRHKKKIGPKVVSQEEAFDTLFEEPTYSEKLKFSLSEKFKTTENITIEHFLKPYSNKVDGLMLLAALCAIENQTYFWNDSPYKGYTLDVKEDGLFLHEHPFYQLSNGLIERREPHV
ncbi:hypothetical protein NLX78_12865 [Paenibacillus sp. Lou8.1]|uniref:hypothetical protein n=1 Tax=Paenibacillus sp. Lou8.1 TaxID=2962041 RepID=UPI0020B80E6D|nr:hypothetical protein [Paenibacillus sp. Lou8.1]MCP3808122.1 hypothetical protein [Paenibacillus sp. Lou8.1]